MVNHNFILEAFKELGYNVIVEEDEGVQFNSIPSDVLKKAKELEKVSIQKEKSKLIIAFTDMLHQKGLDEVVEMRLTPLQENRYKVKKRIAEKALGGDKRAILLLDSEAIEQEVTTDELISYILSLANQYEVEQDKLVANVELIRIKLKKLPYAKVSRLYKEIKKIIDQPVEVIKKRIFNEFNSEE